MPPLPSIRLTGATILREGELRQRSVAISRGRITKGPLPAVDLTGYLVLPGIVDMYFKPSTEPETSARIARAGARAAAAGITTAWVAPPWSWDNSHDDPSQAEALLTRQASFFDSAILSDNAAAALLGVWMNRYFGDAEAEAIAGRTVQSFHAEMLTAPTGLGGLWQVAAFLEAPHTEIAVIGTPAERQPLERELARHFLPFTALAPAEEGGDLPVLEARPGGGQAYVCVNHACQLPTRDPAELARQVAAL